MSVSSLPEGEAIISFRLDPVLTKIVRALLNADDTHLDSYLERAAWICRAIPGDLLRKQLGGEGG